MITANQILTNILLRHDSFEKLNKVLRLVRKIDKQEKHKKAYAAFETILADEKNTWNIYLKNLLNDINPEILINFVNNFFIKSQITGHYKAQKNAERYNCNIPGFILLDPTTSCNLKCVGCWANEYEKNSFLTYEEIDRIINEGKAIGIHAYVYSGGEPLIRKEDLIKLAEKHNDCMFLAFTNGTLIDEKFAIQLKNVSNFLLAISIEGNEEENDKRRGKGTFTKVIKAMDILKAHKLFYGFSVCYHILNTENVGSENFIDFMIDKGCKFGWYFTYVPIGKGAIKELLAIPDQRYYMYRQIRKFRETKSIFLMDFWNDGEYVDGCIAGGRQYIHINANGDVEPCAFIHYSNVNIKHVTLIEALQSSLFKQYRKNQPFNKNHLRPCPLLDNPDKLKEMVHKSNAKSTQILDKESVEDLTDKCQEISKAWAIMVERDNKEIEEFLSLNTKK